MMIMMMMMMIILLVLVLVDVGHGVHLELWLPHSLSSLFLNASADSAVTTDSGRLFQGATTLCLAEKVPAYCRRLLLVSSS